MILNEIRFSLIGVPPPSLILRHSSMKNWIFLLITPVLAAAVIIETPHFEEIEAYAQEDALILLDIDPSF